MGFLPTYCLCYLALAVVEKQAHTIVVSNQKHSLKWDGRGFHEAEGRVKSHGFPTSSEGIIWIPQ